MPRFEDLNWQGLEKVSPTQYAELTNIDRSAWRDELKSHDELFEKLGNHLPKALDARRGQLHQKLGA
jgi:phosphoenolpyruvate carboxykinase (GTP)